jgi:hypothetical protein
MAGQPSFRSLPAARRQGKAGKYPNSVDKVVHVLNFQSFVVAVPAGALKGAAATVLRSAATVRAGKSGAAKALLTGSLCILTGRTSGPYYRIGIPAFIT